MPETYSIKTLEKQTKTKTVSYICESLTLVSELPTGSVPILCIKGVSTNCSLYVKGKPVATFFVVYIYI